MTRDIDRSWLSSSKFNFSSYLLQLNCTMYLIPSQTVQDWPTSSHLPACLIHLEDSLQIYLSRIALSIGSSFLKTGVTPAIFSRHENFKSLSLIRVWFINSVKGSDIISDAILTNLGGVLSIPVDVLSCSSFIILIMSSLVGCLNLNSVKLLGILGQKSLYYFVQFLISFMIGLTADDLSCPTQSQPCLQNIYS